MKLRVKYRCDFDCILDVPDNGMDKDSLLEDARSGELADEIYSEIDIPEGGKNNSVYSPSSYDVLTVELHDDEG